MLLKLPGLVHINYESALRELIKKRGTGGAVHEVKTADKRS